MNPVKFGADIDRACVAALSDEQVDDPMRTTSSKIKIENYEIAVYVTMCIAWSDFKRLIADKADGIFAERNEAVFQAQRKQNFVIMLQRGSCVASNGARTEFVQFMETFVTDLPSGGAVDDTISEFVGRWSKSDKILKSSLRNLYLGHCLHADPGSLIRKKSTTTPKIVLGHNGKIRKHN